jgi:hypothetical protein
VFQAETIFKRLGDKSNAAQCAFNIGRVKIASGKGQEAEASEDWRRALDLAEDCDNIEIQQTILKNVKERGIHIAPARNK